jgi:hypothetical protein
MKNKDLFNLNPEENNLINDGVVEINTIRNDQGLKIIRHEIKTFVCEGEYQRGIYRILDTYLKNIDNPKQPAAWVSGFFGSGKSHLVKLLGYLWEDYKFPGGETARSLKPLPVDVRELFTELDRKQKINGLLSVAGTLKDFPSNDIRYSFLQLFLNALGLPSQFHHFKFVYWAKKEGIYDELKAIIEAGGKDFHKEYENLFVSSALANAVLQLRPAFAENEAKVKENFKMNFKRVDSIDRKEFISTIKTEILPMFYGQKIPCTIIVLDEVQQFIGTDANKTVSIQNLEQDISSNFEGKFLLVGTGQNSLSETPFLQPLQDRFTVKVTLSDTDVETVTRKTVLEKKPSAINAIQNKLEASMGEISHSLSGTDFACNTEDKTTLVADYPILPSVRKFWKKLLQVIDTAGNSGQLRSQLRIVDESIKLVAGKELGYIVPADFIFTQKQSQLLQNALLLNETNNLIGARKAKGGDSVLEGRILSVVFLIDHLPKDLPGMRLKSDEKTIADLLIDNLNESSDAFRNKVKKCIKKLTEEKVLMPVSDEFKLQTRVGAEWEQEFTSQVIKLNNSGDDKIQQFRKDKFTWFLRDKTKSINVLHGVSKLKREFEVWDKTDKPGTDNKLNLWIRDGWFENETHVINEIRAEGADSPLAYVYVKKLRDQDLRNEIIKHIAADLTLQTKGIPSTPEGEQARKSMETRKGISLHNVNELVENICRESEVYLAGGNKVTAGTIGENAKDALECIADRQFPEFKGKGDYKDWEKALKKALDGDPEPLKKIGWTKEPKDHPMAVETLRYIGNNSRSGREIRNYFMKSPYGFSQDGIDTIIVVLKNGEQISTSEISLNQTKIGTAVFKKETHTISAAEKIKLRVIFQEAGISCKPNEEFAVSNTFLAKLKELAEQIGGDSPKPEPISLRFLTDIENLDGNERLLRILQEQEDLKSKLNDWIKKSKLVELREPEWILLTDLMNYALVNKEMDLLKSEAEAILTGRLLLNEPDLVHPLLNNITEKLQVSLNVLKKKYNQIYDSLMPELQANPYFSKLTPEQKHAILLNHQLLTKPELKATDSNGLLNQLQKTSLPAWETKIAALQGQFQSAIEEAIRLSEPKAKDYLLPKRTIKSKEELEEYLLKLKTDLEQLLKSGESIILK